MVSKKEAIKIIIERGSGVVGPFRMMSLLTEAGIKVDDEDISCDGDINDCFTNLTVSFASIAPTTRITLMSLSKIYGFPIFENEKQERKEGKKKNFWRLKNWNFFNK